MTQTTINLLTSFAGSANIASLHSDLIDEVVSLRAAVVEQDWAKTRRFAVRALGLGNASIRMCAIEARTTQGRLAATSAVAAELDGILAGLANAPDDDRADVVAAIREQLGDAVPPDLSAALDLMEGGDTLTATPITKAAADVGPPPLGGVRMTLEMGLAASVRGLLGLVHGELNLTLATIDPDVDLTQHDVKAAMYQFRHSFEEELERCQRALQQALASDPRGAAVGAAIDGLTSLVEEQAPRVGRLQAWSHHTTHALRGVGKDGDAEALGREAAKMGARTREALASHCAASRIGVELSLMPVADDVANVIARASESPFTKQLPNGRDVELAHLIETPDKSFVEVSGFVESIEAFRDPDGKLVSRAGIVDPSSGATGSVAAVFTHLAHAGVTPGAYVRASGTFRVASQLADNEPCIEIDRLSLASIAAEDWRIALLGCAARWFQPWRGGTNAYWSFGPSQLAFADGDVDEANSQFGAGELIYTPFVRDK